MKLVSFMVRSEKYCFFTRSEPTLTLIYQYLLYRHGIVLSRGETLTVGN